MGIEGVSSDEEDDDASARNGYKTYIIRRRPEYLSHNVSVLMRKLDWIYSTRLMASQKKGFTVRFREPGQIPSRRTEPICSLPVNAYDDVWYSKLGVMQRASLAAASTRHDFTVPADFLRHQ